MMALTLNNDCVKYFRKQNQNSKVYQQSNLPKSRKKFSLAEDAEFTNTK